MAEKVSATRTSASGRVKRATIQIAAGLYKT